ncbi:MAG: DUF5788 family protein [Halodesulfurarchaeum sp.]
MQEHERRQLLERIGREAATVGASIPETIEIGEETFDLQAFVFAVKRLDNVPEEKRTEVADAKKRLRRARLKRKKRLESESELARETGERLVEEIIGIDRALHALSTLEPTDLESEEESRRAADRKRWISFLHEVLGREDSDKQRGVR